MLHMISIEDLRHKLGLRGYGDREIRMVMECAEKCHPVAVEISRLKYKRLMHGMTIEELSRKSGVANITIYNIENGLTKRPRLDTLSAIADALGVPVDAIIE